MGRSHLHAFQYFFLRVVPPQLNRATLRKKDQKNKQTDQRKKKE